MWAELNGENGLNLYAETKEGYNIHIEFGYDDRPYTDLNVVAMYLFKCFNIDGVIDIQDNDKNIIATIHKEGEEEE